MRVYKHIGRSLFPVLLSALIIIFVIFFMSCGEEESARAPSPVEEARPPVDKAPDERDKASPPAAEAPELRREARRPEAAPRKKVRRPAEMDRGAPKMGPPPASEAPARSPSFPWPPPKASASSKVPDNFLRETETKQILHDIDRRLALALDKAGYFEKSYFSVPDGFALVTRLEQINADGTPKPEPQRWASNVGPLKEFSLANYIRALFTSNAGYFRVIVFIVTPFPFSQTDTEVVRVQAMAWLHEGLDRLPFSIGTLTYTPAHSCTALIYEFEKIDDEKEATTKIPGRHTGRRHLIKSNLYSQLER